MTTKMRTMTSERSWDGTALRLAPHCLAEHLLWSGRVEILPDPILICDNLSMHAHIWVLPVLRMRNIHYLVPVFTVYVTLYSSPESV